MVATRHFGAVVLVVALLASVGNGPAAAAVSTAPTPSGSWPYPNADLANTRRRAELNDLVGERRQPEGSLDVQDHRPGSEGRLRVRFTGSHPHRRERGGHLQDLYANVYALSLATGKLLWEYPVNSPLTTSLGPDGVAVTGGVVYGDSPSTVFALQAEGGKPIWVDRHLLEKDQGPFGIQPQVAGGRVYLASAVGTGPHGSVLLALRASTGAVLWEFNTLSSTHPGVVAAGGAWETPLVGTDGSVTYGTGNPYQSADSAIEHPSTLAYTDSDVNLTAATGTLRWYYQGVPDDFKDYDMQTSPIAATIGGTAALIGAGKMGEAYAINATTGALMWKTPVGQHNGHDDDSVQALDHTSTLTAPFTYLPGSLGGVLANLAVAGGSAYVATVDLPFRFTALTADWWDQRGYAGGRKADRRGRGAQPGNRESRVGRQVLADAARRRHRVQRPSLHHAVRRRARRPRQEHRVGYLRAPVADLR